MTSDEARALTTGDQVYYGNDPRDRGTVHTTTPTAIVIRWGRDQSESVHQVSNLARVHRWQRGLRGLPRAVEQHLVSD